MVGGPGIDEPVGTAVPGPGIRTPENGAVLAVPTGRENN